MHLDHATAMAKALSVLYTEPVSRMAYTCLVQWLCIAYIPQSRALCVKSKPDSRWHTNQVGLNHRPDLSRATQNIPMGSELSSQTAIQVC